MQRIVQSAPPLQGFDLALLARQPKPPPMEQTIAGKAHDNAFQTGWLPIANHG
jgi:hypothetical protein